MYSVIFDFTHPRLCTEIPNADDVFFDIGSSEASKILIENFMKELTDWDTNPKVDWIFENFCIDRTLTNKENEVYIKLKNISDEIKHWFTGRKPSITKMYLVERKDNKITNIYRRWHMNKIKPDYVYVEKKNKKSF